MDINILEELGAFNPPYYHKDWWEQAKPIFEEYKRKANLWDGVTEVISITKHLIDKDQVIHLMKEYYDSLSETKKDVK